MEIDSQSINEIKPDVAILATGANPIKPKIPGVEAEHVYLAEEVLRNRGVINPGPVVVIGGGCLGAEIAELCALEGREVTVLEAGKVIAKDMGPLLALSYHDRQKNYDIKIMKEVMVTKIEGNKVFYSYEVNEEEFIIAETVILATGYRSDRNLEQTLNELVDEVVLVGDCNEPRKIINAVHEGFHAARMID
jgi:pyruvate/2-oxoglutarate dehydrogenase complex dihydrolipoamide dehydrogenase (E3) component